MGGLCINNRGQQGGYQDGYYGTRLCSLFLRGQQSQVEIRRCQEDGGNDLMGDFQWMTFDG